MTVPAGYTASVLFALGDPIANGVSAYANNGTDSAASFAQRAGDHHDGMHDFALGSTNGLALDGRGHPATLGDDRHHEERRRQDRAVVVLEIDTIRGTNDTTLVGESGHAR